MVMQSDAVFAGSIPENYDRYMVPLIFAPYAEDLARRASAFSPLSVLEVAAGTGAVTRALAPRLAPDATYVATDLNAPMLAFAAAQHPADSRIVWRQADALALPFPDHAFDMTCCQFGAMFFPDRLQAYREARRTLRPGGQLLFNVWDRIEENDFARDVTEALAKVFPTDPPRFLARTPHGYHDQDLIRSELDKAGFKDVLIETRAAQSRATSPRIPALAFCQGTVLRDEIEARQAGALAAATEAVEAALARQYGTGEIVGKIQAHVITATA